ncbi:GntR family transcriptional regulator [Tianweitania sp. BSSL-BM11]|uniref:GntR family transcriptional regulator n=1 Tax=Tianweitania aestuarii TaxID=2814886 RepID=A0ABS5RXT3_9HYPH|nr:GntR family transcriptional regulator [Tianweitania aestuarii]MBS9721845.1 GntR family transcriptional regulator [Tianweitania aestuarii]
MPAKTKRQHPARPNLSPVVTRTTVGDHVYEQLRSALMWGQFEPGQSITIDSLAQEMGTSHMPVREALRRLAVDNGVDITRTGTARVPEVSRERLDDICRARIEIEGLAVELATLKASDADLDRLSVLMRDHEAAAASGEVYEMLHRNHIFHFSLYDLARSDVLSRFISVLWLQMGPYMRLLTHSIAGRYGAPTAPPEENRHPAIMKALRNKDAAFARQLLGEDIRISQHMLQSICAARLDEETISDRPLM